MTIWSRILPAKAEKRNAPTSWDLLRNFAIPTVSGGVVTPLFVESLSAAYGAVQIIAETIGSLPLIVYRRAADGVRQEDPSHPVARLFGRAPNDLQTPAELVTMMMANCLLHGAAYAEIVRDGAGRPEELWPLQFRPGRHDASPRST